MKAILVRLHESKKQTLGVFMLYSGVDQAFSAVTLELPWRENRKKISRIPAGEYKVVKRRSKKFGEHFHVLDVEGRSLILIHAGNFYKQTEGCILLGTRFLDVNKDGEKDVIMSRNVVKLLVEKTDSFDLLITDGLVE